MKTTRPILSGVVASLIPLMLPDVSVAFTGEVVAGASVTDEVIDDSGENTTQRVYGTASSTVINSGGTQIINSGGVTYGTTVNSGGTLSNNGGEDNDTLVAAGGVFTLTGQASSYAVSSEAIIESAATVNNYTRTNNWTITGTDDDYIYLQGSSSVMNNTLVNSGHFWILRGTATNTTLNSGNFVNVSGTDINSVINGGTWFLGGASQAWSENLTINSGGYGDLNSGTLKNATINGSLIVTPNEIRPEILSSLQGEITVNDGGRLIIVTGSDTGSAAYNVAGRLYLASNAPGTGSYSFELGDVTLAGGTLFYDHRGYSTLTVSSLSGSGTFLMYTDIASLLGDFLTVTGNATGSFDVSISDSGVSPTSGDTLQIVQTGGGDAVFTLANSGNVVDLGTYQYVLLADGQGGWSLTPRSAAEDEEKATEDANPDEESETDDPAEDSKTENDDAGSDDTANDDAGSDDTANDDAGSDNTANDDAGSDDTANDDAGSDDTANDDADSDKDVEGSSDAVLPPSGGYVITPSTSAVLSIATADPLIFRQELETLSGRPAASGSLAHDYSVWSTVRNSRLNVSSEAGADYRMGVNALTIGADRARYGENGLILNGLFFSYSHSDMHFRGKGRGKADIDSWSGGLYGAWRHDKGYWLDGALKLNRFAHEVRARMSGGGGADGSFNTTGIGGIVKAGKDFHIERITVTPWLAMTGFVGKSSDLALSNGMSARIGPQRSSIAAAGIRAEYAAGIGQTELHPWASASIEQEMAKKNHVWVNGDGFKNDLSGGRGVYQAGLRAKITPTLAMRMSVGYMQGSHLESPWSATAGVNWTF